MKILFNIILSCFSIVSCTAQAIGKRITQNSVVIYNSSAKMISLLLGEASRRIDTFKIHGNEVWFSPEYNKNTVIFIQTQKHVSKYQLRLGNYYMIFWNGKKQYWDIKKTQKRE